MPSSSQTKSYVITVEEGELAAIVDALQWNIAKQNWLKKVHLFQMKHPVAAEGHRLRQEQAEKLLPKILDIWRQGGSYSYEPNPTKSNSGC